MNDLNDIYRRLAVQRTHEQLAEHYRTAERRGASRLAGCGPEPARPVAVLAAAIPPSATLRVAIHVLHALPPGAGNPLPDRLLDTAEQNAADALHRCQRALELDGAAHAYDLDDWVPVVFDIAAAMSQSARLDVEPPTVVGEAEQAINWLSRSLVELDDDSTEVPGALAEVLARLLIAWMFAALARDGSAVV